MEKQKVVVIGAGFGGLGAAILMARKGYDVTVLEKNDKVGGRANLLEKNGFKRDMGPSWYLMPDAFERYFEAIGRNVSDYLDLKKLEPSYRVYFKNPVTCHPGLDPGSCGPVCGATEIPGQARDDKSKNGQAKPNFIDLYADVEKAADIFESIEKGSGDQLKKYLKSSAYQYDIAMNKFVFKNYDSIFDFMTPQLAIEGLQLNVFSSLYSYVSRFVKTENLKKILMYPSVFLGTSPYQTPALFNIMSHVDFNQGVFYPQGGIYEVPQALYKIALEEGVKFEFGTEVEKIVVESGEVKGVYKSVKCNKKFGGFGFEDVYYKEIKERVNQEVANKYGVKHFSMYLLQRHIGFGKLDSAIFDFNNKFLRNQSYVDTQCTEQERQNVVSEIIDTLKHFPKYIGGTIGRILYFNKSEFDLFESLYLNNDYFSDPGFISFSVNENYINKCLCLELKGQCSKSNVDVVCYFKINLAKNAIDLREISNQQEFAGGFFENEVEVMYLPNSKFKILGRKRYLERGIMFFEIELQEMDDLFDANIVISNADMRHTETKLLDSTYQTYPQSYWEKQVISPSGFIMYLGVDGELPQLKHHTLVFNDDWKTGFDQIFKTPIWPNDPSYYICNPSKTDPSVAPVGKENLFVLVPIAPGLASTPDSLQQYADKILDDIAISCNVPDLKKRVEVCELFSVPQFEQYYNAYKGTALGLAHTMFQSAVWRPNNYSKKAKGLYYSGGYTTPGIGMPMCLISAMLVAERIEKSVKKS